MKTIIFSMGLLFCICVSTANAQMGKDVPAKVSSKFMALYPSVKDVKWHTEEGNYEGKFKYNNKEMSVQINEKGELLQTETYLKVTELPKPAQDYLIKNYAGAKFQEYSEVVNAKQVKHYQAETKDKVIIFDSKGTFMKTEDNDD